MSSYGPQDQAIWVPEADIGVANGVPGLDGNAMVPISELPIAEQFTIPTGWIAQTYNRNGGFTNTAQTITSQALYLSSIVLAKGVKVSNIIVPSSSTAMVTPANWWFALFDSSANLLALTADQLTAGWAASTRKTLAIATVASGAATSFTTTYTGIHYVGVLVNAATPPTLIGCSSTSSGIIFGTPPILTMATATGITTPPAFPYTAVESSYPGKIWAGVS
ncbi:MAG: hypothetical protein KGL39_04290 [Patescibacteria group bacterium]|nr:hypothetical protein [Patescibacteria group bacterium]